MEACYWFSGVGSGVAVYRPPPLPLVAVGGMGVLVGAGVVGSLLNVGAGDGGRVAVAGAAAAFDEKPGRLGNGQFMARTAPCMMTTASNATANTFHPAPLDCFGCGTVSACNACVEPNRGGGTI